MKQPLLQSPTTLHTAATPHTAAPGTRSKPQATGFGHCARLATVATLVVLAAVTTCGCQVLTYSGPNGERFSRSSLGATTALASLTVEADTNGVRHVELRGYTNDTTQALGAVTEAAIRAALQSAK